MQRNLGGAGPDTSSAAELRYRGAGSANGRRFDVVITAVGSYTPTTSSRRQLRTLTSSGLPTLPSREGLAEREVAYSLYLLSSILQLLHQ